MCLATSLEIVPVALVLLFLNEYTFSLIMKIDFLLLSVTLFTALSFADEAAQEATIVPCSETTSLTEAEQNAETTQEEMTVEAESTPIEETPEAAATSVGIAQEEVAPRHPGDDYLELAFGLYESCKSLGQILEQVHNMPTADAAAPEVAALTDRILALMRSESILPPPSVEIQQYVQEHISTLNTAEVSEKAMGRVIDLVTKTDPICYGSAALRTELQRLVRGLLER